jgi:hypothetical protein
VKERGEGSSGGLGWAREWETVEEERGVGLGPNREEKREEERERKCPFLGFTPRKKRE